jgi:hypothetical protein
LTCIIYEIENKVIFYVKMNFSFHARIFVFIFFFLGLWKNSIHMHIFWMAVMSFVDSYCHGILKWNFGEKKSLFFWVVSALNEVCKLNDFFWPKHVTSLLSNGV